MRVIELTKQWNDPVKTEEVIAAQLKNFADSFLPDWVYVQFGIAQNINKMGMAKTQQVIDMVLSKYGRNRLFFVGQHIKTPLLNFRQMPVFCPHAIRQLMERNFYPIPHFACSFDQALARPWDEREYLGSFQGSFQTHWTRTRLSKAFRGPDFKVVDTGMWHFEKDSQDVSRKAYIDLLGNSKVAFCPRGTGPSTIRIWEALAMGCVPMIFSDDLLLPFEEHIDWSQYVLRVPEGKVQHAESFFPSDDELKSMTERGQELYNKNFANDQLYKSIVNSLVNFKVV